jgi:hypothetical protein
VLVMTRILTNGQPVPGDNSHTKLRPDGQQEHYVILSDDERAKGFVEPVREVYVHLPCGTETRMARSIAETFAAKPDFYSGGYCAHCRSHYPNAEFVWRGTQQTVGTRSTDA